MPGLTEARRMHGHHNQAQECPRHCWRWGPRVGPAGVRSGGSRDRQGSEWPGSEEKAGQEATAPLRRPSPRKTAQAGLPRSLCLLLLQKPVPVLRQVQEAVSLHQVGLGRARVCQAQGNMRSSGHPDMAKHGCVSECMAAWVSRCRGQRVHRSAGAGACTCIERGCAGAPVRV